MVVFNLGGMTLAYMLKLFVCIFVEKNKDDDIQREYDKAGSPVNHFSAGILASGICMDDHFRTTLDCRKNFLL